MFVKNKIYNIILIFSFLAILILPGLDNIFKFSSHIKTSFNENRKLAEFPSLTKKENGKFSKKFPQEFEVFYSDNFGFRNVTIVLGNKIFISNNDANQKYLFGEEDWIFENHQQSIKDVIGLVHLKKAQIDRVVEKLHANWQNLKAQNIDYVFVFIPNKHTLYPEYLPKYLSAILDKKKQVSTQADQIIGELLRRYPDFPLLDLRKPLFDGKKISGEKFLYFKTDTHWNGLGMKYGYNVLYDYLKNNNKLALKKTDFILEERMFEGGDLADMSGRHPKYLTSFAKIKNPMLVEKKDSQIVEKVNEIMRNYYGNDRNLENTKLFSRPDLYDETKIYIQHDSFFGVNMLRDFLANSFGNSLFVPNFQKNEMLCKTHDKIIEFYKPNLVIHEMVEDKFNEHCVR